MENTYPFKECIEACLQCMQACQYCARMDLQESDTAMMARCVQLNMECAVMCGAAAQLMTLGSTDAVQVCRLCARFCRRCAEECSRHENEHCRSCAEACTRCAELCEQM